uniref:Secreted protein n=1 Tax=Anopheles farauti TaxID=69004 RepID=A0A182Q805_9DIPT
MNRIIFGVFLILTCRPPSTPWVPPPASGHHPSAPAFGASGGVGIVAVQATPLAPVYYKLYSITPSRCSFVPEFLTWPFCRGTLPQPPVTARALAESPVERKIE